MHIRVLLISLLVIGYSTLSFSQAEWNTRLLANWHQDTLPNRSNVRYNDCWGFTDCSGREYAILGSAKYIHFFDISIPTTPIEIGRFPGNTTSIWRDFKTYQDRAYAVSEQGSDGLFAFDLSNAPDTVIQTFRDTSIFKSCHNIFVDEPNGRLYAAGTNSRSNGLFVFDLTNTPDTPTLIADVVLAGGYVHDIYVRDNIAYCSHGFSGLYVYDMTDPANPIVLGSLTSYPESGYNHSSWVDPAGEYLVFADETRDRSLKMTNIKDLEDIFVTSLFKSTLEGPEFTNSIAHNPFIRGDYAVVSYYHDGLQLYDLTNPDSVINIAYYDTNIANTNYNGNFGAWGVYPFLPSGNIIGSDMQNGLFIIEAPGIDWAPVPVSYTPETAIVSEDNTLCPEESLELTLADNFSEVTWFRNGVQLDQTGLAVRVNETGSYRAQVRSNHCEFLTDPIEIESTNLPVAFLPEPTELLCPNSSFILKAPIGAARYDWYLNDELLQSSASDSIVAETPGNYQVELFLDDCSNQSNVIEIQEAPTPELNFQLVYPATSCEDDELTIIITDTTQRYSLYKDGQFLGLASTDFVLQNSGNYSLVVSNAYCSLSPYEFEYTEFAAEVPTITQRTDSLISSEAISYQWYRNDTLLTEATSQIYEPTVAGNYMVETVDMRGCIAQSEPVLFENPTSNFDIAKTNFLIYPNPFQESFIIEFTENVIGIQLYNGTGQLVQNYRSIKGSRMNINLAGFSAGIYYIRLYGENGSYVQKVIKQ